MITVFNGNNKRLLNLTSCCFRNEVSVAKENGVGDYILDLYSGEAWLESLSRHRIS
jgi:hypothetical protein